MRKPSCLISWNHSGPAGTLWLGDRTQTPESPLGLFGFQIFTICPDASRFAAGQEAYIGSATVFYGTNCPHLVSLTSAGMNEVLRGWHVVFLHEAIQISDHGFSRTANVSELGFNEITGLKFSSLLHRVIIPGTPDEGGEGRSGNQEKYGDEVFHGCTFGHSHAIVSLTH